MLIEILLGLVVGIIMALTGAGGGILAVPLLVFGAGLNLAQAAPVGLLAVGVSAAFGAVLGLKKGIVRYKAALLMASAGMVLAPLGVWLANRIDNRWLSVLFALVLLFVAMRTYLQAKDDKDSRAHERTPPCIVGAETGKFIWTGACARSLALSGSIAGLLSGLLGVGGGFVMVPALKRYTDLVMQSIIASSLAVIALVSISGVTSSALTGSLDWNIALPFAAGAVGGMLAGRSGASRIPAATLQKGFATLSAVVAVGMIIRALLQ
ncbi:MAG: sulfite exporter TauE/SafE family protein [Burkholderiaceae bacterium]